MKFKRGLSSNARTSDEASTLEIKHRELDRTKVARFDGMFLSVTTDDVLHGFKCSCCCVTRCTLEPECASRKRALRNFTLPLFRRSGCAASCEYQAFYGDVRGEYKGKLKRCTFACEAFIEVPPEHVAMRKLHASGLAQCNILEQFTIQARIGHGLRFVAVVLSVERLLDIAQSAYEPCTMVCSARTWGDRGSFLERW